MAPEDADPGPLHVVTFPYLPLGERRRVGSWELIPYADFAATDAQAPYAERMARLLFDAYETPESDFGTVFGAVARRFRGRVGDRIRPSSLRPLHHAVLLAALDTNPRSREDGNAHITSDNAVVWGQPIDASGRIGAVYGQVVQTWIGGMKLGEEQARFRPPPELPAPVLGRDIDARYADAMWRALVDRSPAARHLGAACDWLDLAWRNTPSMTQNSRLLALYSGFEALFPHVDGRLKTAGALSRLLEDPGTRRRPHTYVPRPNAAPVTKDLTDLEWWFMRFGDVRNAIAHGRAPTRSQLRHGRQWHFWIAEERLRDAITKTVADETGTPELLLDFGTRAIHWALMDAGI